MQAYQPPQFQRRNVDRQGDFIMQGGKDFGEGIAKGISSLGESLGKALDNRSLTKSLDRQWDVLTQAYPTLKQYDDEFYGANSKGKQGVFSVAKSILDIQREDELSKPVEGKTRAGTPYLYDKRDGRITSESAIDPVLPMETNIPDPSRPGQNLRVNPRTGEPIEMPGAPVEGDWRAVPDAPGKLGHYVPGKGFTGAQMAAGTPGGPPMGVKAYQDPITRKWVYLDVNGEVIDQKKMFDAKPVPGTGRPASTTRIPTPWLTGMPSLELKDPGEPQQMRPIQQPKPRTAAELPRMYPGANGLYRQWPDGRAEWLNPGDEDKDEGPSWVPVEGGMESELLPDQFEGGDMTKPIPGAAAPQPRDPRALLQFLNQK